MNYIYLGVALFMAVMGAAAGYGVTSDYYQHKIASMQAEQQKAVVKAQTEAAQTAAKQDSITRRIANAYASDVATVQHYYASRVRQSAANCTGSVPTAAQGTGLIAPTASDPSLAERCTETTLMLVQLQDWVKQEGMAGAK